jgi:hypothetical protein
LGGILGKLGGRRKGNLAGFSSFGRQHDFRDGGDDEADRLAGPRRARDSRRGGRQRCWGGTRWATARVRAVPVGFAARVPRVREGEVDRGFEGNNRAQRESLKTPVI